MQQERRSCIESEKYKKAGDQMKASVTMSPPMALCWELVQVERLRVVGGAA